MSEYIMAVPGCNELLNREDVLTASQQWSNIRNTIYEAKPNVAIISGYLQNTTIRNCQLGKQAIIIGNDFLNLTNNWEAPEIDFDRINLISKFLEDHQFQRAGLGGIHNLMRFNPLNTVLDLANNILWVGINDTFNFDDFSELQKVLEKTDIMVRALEMNLNFDYLTQCLNVIDDKILIFEDAFKEHSLYILSTWYNLINRIAVSGEDMNKKAINSILLDSNLVMAYCSDELEEKLSLKGISVIRREVDYLTNFGTKSLVVAYE